MKDVEAGLNTGTPEEWGRQIQDARILQGCTQAELAKRAGVTITTLYRAEQGLPVRQSSLRKIAAGLDIRYEQFLKQKPILRPERTPYLHHRAKEGVWYAHIDRRRHVPEDNERLVQSPAERLRLGRLGLTPIFVCYPNLVMPEGPGTTLIELYGRYDSAFNPTIYRDCILYCQRGSVRLQILGKVVEMVEGDIVGFVSRNLEWIEPAAPIPPEGPAPLVLWVGAVRLGKVAFPKGKRAIVRHPPKGK